MEIIRYSQLLSLIQLLLISRLNDCSCAKGPRVQIYDHRGYHDPIELYGRGPWKFFSHGYGIDYGRSHDGSYNHEKGYEFVKAIGREFCKPGVKCRPPDPNFWSMTSLTANGYFPEPYLGRPDIRAPKSSKTQFIADDEKTLNWKNYFMDRA